MKWAFWRRGAEEEAIQEIDQRLEQIEKDDKKIDDLGKRMRKVIVENNLAPAIRRALEQR